MKAIIKFIDKRAEDQNQNPFIQWLDDESIPAKVRLSKWLLYGAFFIFGFKDLNSMILGYPESEAATDKIKKAINAHTKEDSTHWGWYLNDIKKLGLDKEMNFTETIQFLWADRTEVQRLATYRICQLAAQSQDPILRYCLIKSIESFGHVIFGSLTKVSEQYEKETNIELQYLGQTHFDTETGDLIHQEDNTEEMIMDMELDEATRKLGLEIARETCDLIERRWREFYECVTRH